MLCSIAIRDLAVVESLELDLHSGLTVLTGETGAGKSILLTAMGLALGDRADSGFIRPGADKAEINLQFDLKHCTSALTWLDEQEMMDDTHCIVRRILNRDGRSKAFINGSAVTLQTLQELGEKLIDIHGQHAHLTLLHRNEQRRILDSTADSLQKLEQIDSLCQQWNQIHKQLKHEPGVGKDVEQRKELITFQIQELEHCDIENLDYQKLLIDHKLQANLGEIVSTGQAQLNQLYDNERQSVNSQLGDAVRALSELTGVAPEFNTIVELLNDAQIQVQESGQLLRRYLDTLEINPRQLESLEHRLSVLHELARKHQTTPEELPTVLEHLLSQMEQIEHSAENIARLENQLKGIQTQYRELAEDLSGKRKIAAIELQTKIIRMIQELGMPQGNFEINIASEPNQPIPNPKGFDSVEFCVTTNPGLPTRPLAKVASGGELSRISLAIQVAAIDSSTTPTMVFDEVDSGIGGGVAEIVGQRLRSLGDSLQVLCITHLPQVAAQSHHHLLVEKTNPSGETRSVVRPLTASQRQKEIARMLGGVKITDQTLAHAQEMLDWWDNPAKNSQ